MTAAGLDFGTSNTTLGAMTAAGPALLPLEGESTTIPSAIFYPQALAAEPIIGREAVAAYVDGQAGRLMRALKSVLGSPLIDETTLVGRQRIRFRAVIAAYVGRVKRRAERAAGRELTHLVHGRPVHFVDGDAAADARAEATLREIALEAGFAEVSFQYEPIAAGLDYETQVTGEVLAFIADIGGGTSDFSVVRLGPDRMARADRAADILANDGVRIGGTDFDRQFSLGVVMPLLGLGSPLKRAGLSMPVAPYHDLATWSAINRLYEPRVMRDLLDLERDSLRPDLVARLVRVVEDERGHGLAIAVEEAKIAVADHGATVLDLAVAERGLSAAADHDRLVGTTNGLAERIGARVRDCLRQAGVAAASIDALFLTGGSTRLSHVRDSITAALPGARVVEGDTFGSVGTGLTLEAVRRYGG